MFKKRKKTSPPKNEQLKDIEGAFEIMILIFSGMPNLQWSITPDNPLYNTINELFTDAKKNNQSRTIDDAPSHLGFTGFLVRENGQTFVSARLFCSSLTKELQKYLLETAPESEVEQSFKEKILKYIDDED